MKSRDLCLFAAAGLLLLVAACTQPPQPPPSALRVSQGVQGRNTVYHTEVRPDFWVHGRPDKPIFAGSALIVPEAYDYVPAQGGGR